MLKWTVTNKRVCDSDIDPLRSLADPSFSNKIMQTDRRRSVAKSVNKENINHRRSLGCTIQKQSNRENRRSLGNSVVKRANIKSLRGKENQCTSTPNMESSTYIRFETIALRDVSNITPTNTPTTPKFSKINKQEQIQTFTPANLTVTSKKRPYCPPDTTYNSILPTETPKTHRIQHYASKINVVNNFVEEKFCMEEKPLISTNYASTLPAFEIEYSPCTMRPTQSLLTLTRTINDPLLSHKSLSTLPSYSQRHLNPIYFPRKDEEDCPPIKKQKTLASNISAVISPELIPCNKVPSENTSNQISISPLAMKLKELRFSKMSFQNAQLSKTSDIVINENNNIESVENSFNKSQMGDETLSKMIDDILASAKMSPTLFKSKIKEQQLRNELENNKNEFNEDNFVNVKVESKGKLIKTATTCLLNGEKGPRIKPGGSRKCLSSQANLPQPSNIDIEVIHKMISNSEVNPDDRIILLDPDHFNEREVKTPDRKLDNSSVDSILKSSLETFHITTGIKSRKRVSSNPISQVAESPLPPNASPGIQCNLKRMKCVRRRRLDRETDTNPNNVNSLTLPNGIPSPDSTTKVEPIIKSTKLNCITRNLVEESPINNLTLPNGIPSPGTPLLSATSSVSISSLMLGQQSVEKQSPAVSDAGVYPLGASLERVNNLNDVDGDDLTELFAPFGDDKRCKTRRCLTFSPLDTSDKRRSVASSTSSRSGKSSNIKGTLDLAIFTANGKINIHVIRCRDLQRTNGSMINAYVKIAIIPSDENDAGFQRTNVHKDSSKPQFDQRFTFDLNTMDTDGQKRIHVAVWHRDRECRRSEFLGCMSFAVKHAVKKDINGSFRLLSQTAGKSQNLPVTSTPAKNNETPNNLSTLLIGETSKTIRTEPTSSDSYSIGIKMGENSQSSVEEVFSVEEANLTSEAGLPNSLNKRVLHQKDADENLFLRYLELDPVEGPDAPQAAIQRKASGNKSGRTPFTTTKRLIRPESKGFGFTIVWTHPPRVERVDPGLPADKAGILPGDYVIFVDKQNVVMMPEIEMLNLIASCGNTLTLEIFRRSLQNGGLPHPHRSSTASSQFHFAQDITDLVTYKTNQEIVDSHVVEDTNSCLKPTYVGASNNTGILVHSQQVASNAPPPRSSTACSATTTTSLDLNRRRLHLPQVTFSKETVFSSPDEARRRSLYSLVNLEQHYVTAMSFGMSRFVAPLAERHDLISATDHQVLFQNSEDLYKLSDDILDAVIIEDSDPQVHLIPRVYLNKIQTLTTLYKRYCTGLKKADCVLVNKTRNSSSDFMRYISEPVIPRRRPDLTSFIHKPLEHYREIFKIFQTILSQTKPNIYPEEFVAYSKIVRELQTTYREITTGLGLMEPVGEGKPLLSVQDLESRLVFTKCKPFVLTSPGRRWIFGGNLCRVDGRSVRPYWVLLFSDLLLFAKVSRDRVLFITEEPLPLVNITDSCFNIRKKNTEFRITVDPAGRTAESPTAHCGPDLTRTPRRNSRRRSVILRAPTTDLKAVWQNLLQRQIFHVNSTLGCTPQSSPLESPDAHPIMTSSVATLHSMDSCYGGTTITTTNVQQQQLQNNIQQSQIVTTTMSSLQQEGNPNPYTQQQHGPGHHTAARQCAVGVSETDRSTNRVTARQIDEIIDNKCRQLGKTVTSRGGAIHLAQWMKGHLGEKNGSAAIGDNVDNANNDVDDQDSDQIEVWSTDELKRRSRELHLVDMNGTSLEARFNRRSESRCEEIVLSDTEPERSPSRSTTSDSQVTVRSSPVVPETVTVCRQCRQSCLSKPTSPSLSNNANSINNNSNNQQCTKNHPCCKNCQRNNQNVKPSSPNANHNNEETTNERNDVNDDEDNAWSPLMLMGLAAGYPAAGLMKLDPFAPSKLPKISIVPPSPDSYKLNSQSTTSSNNSYGASNIWESSTPNGGLHCKRPSNINESKNSVHSYASSNAIREESVENSPEDSPQDEDPPYLSLNCNTGLKRYGTMSSLERLPSDEVSDEKTLGEDNSSDEDIDEVEDAADNEVKSVPEAANNTVLKGWTARAGSYVAEKMALFERLGYLRTSEIRRTEDEEEFEGEAETSGATSGEEIWGTPTSGGEIEDLQAFPNSEATQSSPTRSSSSATGDDETDLMMDDLLMAPPMTAASVRGLLPRRRLEPLMEEDDDTETCTTTSDPAQIEDATPSPEQGSVSGNVADISFPVLESYHPVPENTPSPINILPTTQAHLGSSPVASNYPVLSPKLEMRLALNHNIMNDEDLLCYRPHSPDSLDELPFQIQYPADRDFTREFHRDLAKDFPKEWRVFLPTDLSRYQKMTSHDLINRTINKRIIDQNQLMRMPPRQVRRRSLSISNSSASAQVDRESSSLPLTEMERLARAHILAGSGSSHMDTRQPRHRRQGRDETGLAARRSTNKFFGFLGNKSTDKQLLKIFSREIGEEIPNSLSQRPFSPRSQNDRQLDRRFWKQLRRRRRLSNSNSTQIPT